MLKTVVNFGNVHVVARARAGSKVREEAKSVKEPLSRLDQHLHAALRKNPSPKDIGKSHASHGSASGVTPRAVVVATAKYPVLNTLVRNVRYTHLPKKRAAVPDVHNGDAV